jgi:hypothetical protein
VAPWTDPRVRTLAYSFREPLEAKIRDPQPIGSQYEGKAILAVATYARATGDGRALALARRWVRWLGTYVPTQDTGLYGEHYYNVRGPDGRPRSMPSTSLPHAWEHTLFYLAALTAY